jgi:hypothetical protein
VNNAVIATSQHLFGFLQLYYFLLFLSNIFAIEEQQKSIARPLVCTSAALARRGQGGAQFTCRNYLLFGK